MDKPLLVEDKVIKVGKKNLEESSIFENTDITLDPSINLDDLIVIASPLKNMGRDVERTLSDGRAVGYEEIGLITDENGIIYNDILVKGIGGTEKVMNIRMQTDTPNPENVVEFVNSKSGRSFPRRFVDEKIRSITGNFGYSLPDKSHLDYVNSETLARKGLRTRRLLLSGTYSNKVIFSTPNGPERGKELGERKLKPVIELWVMRCRYRMRDIQRLMFYELDFPAESQISYIAKGGHKIEDTYAQRIISLRDKADQTKTDNAKVFIANEVLERIAFEKDNKFADLYERYKEVDLQDKQNIDAFLNDYLLSFSFVLGDQVGLMYHLGAFTKDKMLNNQNVTLLAEIVDHDVTYIDELSKSSLSMFFYQVFQSWESLNIMLGHFLFLGVIDEGQSKQILDNYLNGFIQKILKINNHDTNNILSVIFEEQFEDLVEKKLPGHKEYESKLGTDNDLQTVIDLRAELGQDLEKNVERKKTLEERKTKLAWDSYNKRWVNKEDYNGSGNFLYLATRLRELIAENLEPIEKVA